MSNFEKVPRMQKSEMNVYRENDNSIPSLETVQHHHIGKQKYKLPVTCDSEYVIDDSCFIPMSEAVKQLGLNPNFTGADYKTAYDFPDGKDSGIEIPINRTKNGKDIAELSSSIAEQQDNISNEIKKVEDFEKFKQKKQSEMNVSKENVQKSTIS